MNRTLVVISSLSFGVGKPGKVRVTGKFISGMDLYVKHWDGPVTVLAEPDAASASDNLDDEWHALEELPFSVVTLPLQSPEALEVMRAGGVVMGGPDHRLNHVAKDLASRGVPYVMVTEYSLKTRWQIIDADALPIHRELRRKVWAAQQEVAALSAIRKAAAVQCNGTPTFELYRHFNGNTMLFFDSRVSEDMIPAEPALARPGLMFDETRPIRLAFSGRLNAMKGADHLVKVAGALRERGVPFRMDIYGDGPLVPAMRQEIAAQGLEKQVVLGGVLDFSSELMPRIRDEVDLFVCCHRQGDPSCTYLETMACGVPIVGYGNEAFRGLLRQRETGHAVAMDDWRGLADQVQRLCAQPLELARLARQSLSFAAEHTFEREFVRRIEQMRGLQAKN